MSLLTSKISWILFSAAATLPLPLFAGDTAKALHHEFWGNWSLMSQLHGTANISRYFLQKNRYFTEHYYVEGAIGVEAAIISYRDFVHWVWAFDVHPGMGQTINNIVFDPIDINFGVMPIIEFHVQDLVLQNGLDHRCFHEVDRQNFYPIYYNQIFLLAGSRDFRLGRMWQALNAADGWNFSNRTQWRMKWGYFIREFFGWIEPVMLNDMADNVTNIHEAEIDVRFAIYRSPYIMAFAHGSTLLGQAEVVASGGKKKIQGYWREEVAVELMPGISKFGGFVFIKYIWDDFPRVVVRSNPTSSGYEPGSLQPRLSKDRLLQIGIGYFF